MYMYLLVDLRHLITNIIISSKTIPMKATAPMQPPVIAPTFVLLSVDNTVVLVDNTVENLRR